MARFNPLKGILFFSFCVTVGCASETAATPAPELPAAAPTTAAKEDRSWRDRLGITYVANSLYCTYKLLGFFAGAPNERNEPKVSAKDVTFNCLGNKF